MKTKKIFFSTTTIAVALLSGCAIGPDYERPENLPMASDYRSAEGLSDTESIANKGWWEVFNDQELLALIDEGLQNNLDLQIAVTRVEEAVAALDVAKSYYWPTLGAGLANTARARVPSDNHRINTNYTATGNVSWEIDIWGKYRRMNEAARAQMLSSEQGKRAVSASLVANIAQSWFQLRTLRESEAILMDTIASQKKSLGFMKILFDGEALSEMEYRQSESLLASTEAQLPSVQRQIGLTENALSILLGRTPGSIKTSNTSDLLATPDIPVGLPSELLERRPDVLGAEQDLVSANANVGVVKAEFLPSIGLTGAFGIASSDLEGLVKDNFSEIVSIGPTVDYVLFDGGRRSANYEIAKINAERAVLAYRSTILTALREVADELNNLQGYRDEINKQTVRAAAAEKVLKFTRLRYDEGIIPFMDVLDAEREALAARMDLSNSKFGYNSSYIQLYKSLGGGWETHDDYQASQNKDDATVVAN